jgi:hypothetical protein
MDGAYRVEFENIDGELLRGGTIVFSAGRFEGGTGGFHYAGKFEVEADNRFRAEGSVIKHDSAIQKLLRRVW